VADNITLNAGTGGATVAADDIASVWHQRVKISVGADGSATDMVGGAGAVSAAVPRVTLASDDPAVAALQILDNAISGSEMQVDVVAALPAGTNNIGDVDVLSVVPGTGATALGKAVDSVAGATDTGVAALFVRDDSLSTLTPADGDYVPGRVDSTGALHVRVSAGGIAGITDDAAFTPGTSEVLPIGFQADETSPDSVDEGDIGCPRMSLDRKQYVIAHNETASVYQNGTARTPQFAAISGSTSGDNTLVAAAGAGNKIRVLSLYLVAAGTTTVRFESGAGGTALSGAMSLVANTGLVLPFSPAGHFETAANTLLNMELNAAVQVSGSLTYIVVT
jgi:hypothetical protein